MPESHDLHDDTPFLSSDGTFRVRWGLVLGIVAIVASVFAGYTRLNERISNLDSRLGWAESRQRDQSEDVREIKSDIKTLLRRSTP